MKLPIEWLKQYIKTDKTAEELGESFTALGLMLDKPVFTYENGTYKTEVLDLEHRMDRADWLSILGCARDLAAFENTELINPALYTAKGGELPASQKIKIEVKCPELVNRFNTRIFKNVTVKASPDWLKNRLEAYGIPSINNIVDITNYVMVEQGQTMHAQDIKKMSAPEIVIRRAKKGETLQTLLGETITLDEEAFVLTQNDKATVLGGIVGGAATGVDDDTTNIVIDSGNYNQTNIRKTSRKVKIQNESVSRNDKFLHPAATEIAIQRATGLILELAGGEYYENEDWYPTEHPTKHLALTFDRVKTISGLELKPVYIKSILTKLEYTILRENKDSLQLEVPFFRTDVEVEDDIVSDILRINDYKNIPLQQIDKAPPKDITPKIYAFEDRLRDICVNLGLHEHITDPLISASDSEPNQVKLENSQSQLKNALRTNIYDGLKSLAKVYAKHQIESVALFEVGKVYLRQNIASRATEYRLSASPATEYGLSDFSEPRITQIYIKKSDASHNENSIEIRSILTGILSGIGITDYKLTKAANAKANVVVGDKIVGYIGWDQITLLNEQLLPLAKTSARVVTEFTVTRTDDISILVPTDRNLGEVAEIVKKVDKKITEVEIIPQDYGSSDNKYKNVLVRITHEIEDFSPVRERVVSDLKAQLGASVK